MGEMPKCGYAKVYNIGRPDDWVLSQCRAPGKARTAPDITTETDSLLKNLGNRVLS